MQQDQDAMHKINSCSIIYSCEGPGCSMTESTANRLDLHSAEVVHFTHKSCPPYMPGFAKPLNSSVGSGMGFTTRPLQRFPSMSCSLGFMTAQCITLSQVCEATTEQISLRAGLYTNYRHPLTLIR